MLHADAGPRYKRMSLQMPPADVKHGNTMPLPPNLFRSPISAEDHNAKETILSAPQMEQWFLQATWAPATSAIKSFGLDPEVKVIIPDDLFPLSHFERKAQPSYVSTANNSMTQLLHIPSRGAVVQLTWTPGPLADFSH